MQYLKPLVLRDWSKGTWRGTQNSVAPVNSLRLGLNLDTDLELGSGKVRKGLTQIGEQLIADQSCYGLHYFIDAVAYDGSRSPSISTSISPSVSTSLSPSASPSISVSISPSVSVSISPSVSTSISPSSSPSASVSPSVSLSVSPSLSFSPSVSVSISPSVSPSTSLSPSASPSVSPSVSPSTGTESKLFAVFPDGSNNDIYDVDTTQKSLEDDTQNLRTRFLTYLDNVLRINGTDSAKAWDGSDWLTTGGAFDLDNIPSGNLAIEWRDRVYIAGDSDSPDKLYYSGIADSSGRTVSWTVDNGYIMMEQEDGGGGITALAKCPGYLLVFKRRSLKRWDGSSTYPDDMVRQGTPSQECVCNSRGMVAWLNESGIWATVGGMPKHLSDVRVNDFIKAITNFDNVHCEADEDNLYFYIGDVTVDGVDYSNIMLKYNLDYQTWDIRSYYQDIKAMAQYVDDNKKAQIIVGDSNGNVAQMNTGTTDMGKAIAWSVETQDLEFTSRAKNKTINKFFVLTSGVAKGTVLVRSDSKREEDFKRVGEITGDVSEMIEKTSGKWFNFKVTDSCDTGEAVFMGLEFVDKSIEVLDI